MRDIGRRCFLTLVTGFCLEIGTTSAIFQEDGHLISAKFLFRTAIIERDSISAYSFKNQLGIPSGSFASEDLAYLRRVRRQIEVKSAESGCHGNTGRTQFLRMISLVL